MAKFKGVCRRRGKNGSPNKVVVTDGDMLFEDITEEYYSLLGAKPPLEELPWC